MMQDDPLDPAAKNRLMDGLMGPPPGPAGASLALPGGRKSIGAHAFGPSRATMPRRSQDAASAIGAHVASAGVNAAPASAPGLDAGGPVAPVPGAMGGQHDPRTGQRIPDSPGGSLQTVDRSKWDTDGYATPQFTGSNFGAAPGGFDSAKWNDANHQTPKYVIGRMGGQYMGDGQFTDDEVQSFIADIQKAYPGAQFNGKDKVSIDGGQSWVDVIEKAGTGDPSQRRPGFMPDEGSAISDPGLQDRGAFGMLSPTLGGDPQAAIQDALSQISQPQILELIQRLQQGA